MSLTTYYDYRIANTQAYLDNLNKSRDTTIARLKAATKYDTTQQLLEKYGASPKTKDNPAPASRKKSQGPQKPGQYQGPRTGMAPPPTANIQRAPTQQASTPKSAPSMATPQRTASMAASPRGTAPLPSMSPPDSPGAEFAPNAYEAAQLTKQYSSSTAATFTQSHWYDRILDALLGEDETQPKNRLALICHSCRLVNGQAPPGTRSLDDVGRWRCSGCGAWNGKEKVEEDVMAGLVQDWKSERETREKELGGSTDGGADSDEGSGIDVGDEASEEMLPPSKSTRSKKGKK